MTESWRNRSRRPSSCSPNGNSSPRLPCSTTLTTWRCRTCNRPIHTSGNVVGECLLICISTHQTKFKWTKMQEDLPEPVLIPTQIQDRSLLFDDIWFDFQELKDMNEKHRQQVSSTIKDRGALKVQAPLPWLLYRRRDSKNGQTRNQENYNQVWESCVNSDDGLGPPIRFLTIKKSDLAENARRSRLSNDDTRSDNYFTLSRSSSTASSVCESPLTPHAGIAFPPSFGNDDLLAADFDTLQARKLSALLASESEWRPSPPLSAERTLIKDLVIRPRIRRSDSRAWFNDEPRADLG